MYSVNIIKSITISLLFTISLVANAKGVEKSIAENNLHVMPLMNGQMVPEVDVVTLGNESISLKHVLNNQKTILFFYRGGWCPFCNTQMGQLKAIEGELKTLGFQLIGISTDSVADLKKSIIKHDAGFQLLSDFNSTTSQAFGLAYLASQNVTDRYLAGMQLKNPLQKNKAGVERLVLPVPAIYIIDSKGLVQFNYVNPNYKVRLHPELLLKAAQLVK